MTYYTYISSNEKLNVTKVNGSLALMETNDIQIPGFSEAIQLEIMNGAKKTWELRELYYFIQQHMTDFQQCTVEVGNVLNSIHHEWRIDKQETIQLDAFKHFKQLSLQEGTLLRIIK